MRDCDFIHRQWEYGGIGKVGKVTTGTGEDGDVDGDEILIAVGMGTNVVPMQLSTAFPKSLRTLQADTKYKISVKDWNEL